MHVKKHCWSLILIVQLYNIANVQSVEHALNTSNTTNKIKEMCGSGDFECKSGSVKCVLQEQVCDSIAQCDDRSDEHHCHRCTGNQGNWFHCGNNKNDCIAAHWRCDGESDCADGSDEENCGHTSNKQPHVCTGSEFECDSGQCIPNIWFCDGHHDCLDRSDEDEYRCKDVIKADEAYFKSISAGKGNESSTKGTVGVSHLGLITHDSKICEDDSFLCSSGQCVPRRWVCDGTPDCPDQSDEHVCPHADHSCKNLTMQGHETFLCADGQTCIKLTEICDDVAHCPDGSDEGPTCKTSCLNMECEQSCMPSPIQKQGSCFCTGDYTLSDDKKTCVDINECEEFGSCSQDCQNLVGGYTCTCKPGYTDVDGTCKATGNNPAWLFFSSRSKIQGLDMMSNTTFNVTSSNVDQAIAVTYDHQTDRVYWSDFVTNGSIASAQRDGSDAKLFLKSGKVGLVESMVIDYITRNLYFTDSMKKIVGVCSLDGESGVSVARKNNSNGEPVCSNILSNIDQPRGLALYPKDGLLFYTSWGENPHIGRAGMDGSHQEAIIYEDIGWPNGIVVDVVLKRIYWSDAKHGRIETADFNGRDRKTIFSQNVQHPFSLAIFEDTLYWSDWQKQQVQSCNKFDGDEHKIVVQEKELHGISIYHPLLEVNHTNPCSNTDCSHLCLLANGGNSYTCGCPSPKKWHLAEDGVSCHFHFDTGSTLPLSRDFAYSTAWNDVIDNSKKSTNSVEKLKSDAKKSLEKPTKDSLTGWPYEAKIVLGVAILLMVIIIVLLVLFAIRCGFIPVPACCLDYCVWKKSELLPGGMKYTNPAFGLDSGSSSPSRTSYCSTSSELDRIAPRKFASDPEGTKKNQNINKYPWRNNQDRDNFGSGDKLSANNLEGWNHVNFDDDHLNLEIEKDDTSADSNLTKPNRLNIFGNGEKKLGLPLWQKDYTRLD